MSHAEKCDRCHWPLYERAEDGCTRGNCSRRPMPPKREKPPALQGEGPMYFGVPLSGASVSYMPQYLRTLADTIQRWGTGLVGIEIKDVKDLGGEACLVFTIQCKEEGK